MTWLTDAVAAGARILTGVQADTISTAEQAAPGGTTCQQHTRKVRASGVQCSISDSTGRPLTAAERRGRVQIQMSSRFVVSSCGAVHTPALLLRSGIKARGESQHPSQQKWRICSIVCVASLLDVEHTIKIMYWIVADELSAVVVLVLSPAYALRQRGCQSSPPPSYFCRSDVPAGKLDPFY